MIKNGIEKYKYALMAFGIYSAFIAVLLFYIFWTTTNNLADSGESGILLLIPASPWVFLIPKPWLGPLVGFSCIVFNGILISVFNAWDKYEIEKTAQENNV